MGENKELDLALNFIENTDRNVFLTGKAGTGKTTFLHQVKSSSLKRMVVVAPTGVAAINAKGVTIHSFFQLPFGPILPNTQSPYTDRIQRKFSRTKIDIIKSLDLVIIDEISMVRADVLDGIDEVLRRYKDRTKVFGGAQVLMIGDLQQLAPVIRPEEWQLLKAHYTNAYFFSSKAYQLANPISIELKHIYRQQNEVFINILNEVRNDCLSPESIALLNANYQPDFESQKGDGYITLTTHNKKADHINQSQLDQLDSASHVYTAEIYNNFQEKNFPNDEHLQLKVGAQVMFIKNDSAFEKRYYNGKIGVIIALEDDQVTVKCGEDDIIYVDVETWENIKYSIDKDTQEITEVLEGSYTQIPLRLAWAITIHKSQGLTFDKAIIDAEDAFAHGQTYVALSRCKTLEGMILKTPIQSKSIVNDASVKHFNDHVEAHPPTTADLEASKKQYQQNLIAALFSFHGFVQPVKRLIDLYYTHQNSIEGTLIEPLLKLKDQGIIPLLKVAHKFNLQLEELSQDLNNLETDDTIQERFQKGLHYFKTQTEEQIKAPFDQIQYTTDNKQVNKDLKKQLEVLAQKLVEKRYCLKHIDIPFSTQNFLEIRAKASLEEPQPLANTTIKSSTQHQTLFETLRELRADIALAENINHFQVFTQKSLYEMCDVLPTTLKQLRKINGMGKIRVQNYGDEILEVITDYCQSNGITITEDPPEKTSSKVPTKQVTYELFKSGLSITDIAEKRGLVQGTIESHLTSYIANGDLEISELMDKKKFEKAKRLIQSAGYERLSEVKDILGDDYSWGELRMIIAAI